MSTLLNQNMKKLLLHVCCGTCGAWLPRRLAHDWDVDLFYFNPNIHPEEEYVKRLDSVREMASELGLKLIEGEYDPKAWFEAVIRSGVTSGRMSEEREGGTRCDLCFKYRLGKTARYASENGYKAFASTLTVGRRKPAAKVNPIGLAVAREWGIEFVDGDWKRGGGEDLSQLLAREHNVYRQEYCGCVYSKANIPSNRTNKKPRE